MKKIIVLNLRNLEIEGDILDFVFEENNVECDGKLEVAIDSIKEEGALKKKYDVCTSFCNAHKIFRIGGKEDFLSDITKYLKDNGEIYLWDLNKNVGEIIDISIKIVINNGKIIEKRVKNINPFTSSNLEEMEKLLEKSYKIEETKMWEDLYFIKAKKIKN